MAAMVTGLPGCQEIDDWLDQRVLRDGRGACPRAARSADPWAASSGAKQTVLAAGKETEVALCRGDSDEPLENCRVAR